MGKQQRDKLVFEGCFQLWRFLVVTHLNGQYLDWKNPLFGDGHESTQAQRESERTISKFCRYFVRNPGMGRAGKPFEVLCTQKGVDYSGEETSHALPLRLGELLPGLPDENTAGSLDALALAGEGVREWLADPELALLPRSKWPKPVPKARMNVSQEEWVVVAQELVRRNILEPIERDRIFRVPGKNGLVTSLCSMVFLLLKRKGNRHRGSVV